MENKFLTDLVEKLNIDLEFRKKLFEKETLDDMYEFASNSISGYTKEEFAEIIRLFQSLNVEKEQLLDDELDKISGGEESLISVFLKFAPSLCVNLSTIFTFLSKWLQKSGNKYKFYKFLKENNISEKKAMEIINNPSIDPQKAQLINQFLQANGIPSL